MQRDKQIRYIHLDSTDSTNNWAKRHAHTLDPVQITCITALEQTAGRGRFQRRWISPKGENIYATLYFTLPKESSYLINLAQLLSLSCATVLESKGFHPQIKWPNDLLLSGKKIAGILCECLPHEKDLGIVLGIGINVNMTEKTLNTIDQPATSLLQLSGHVWTSEEILDPLLHLFLENLDQLQQQGFGPFVDPYNARLAFKNEEISCHLTHLPQEIPLRGRSLGVDREGRLELLLPSGEKIHLLSCDFEVIPKNLSQ
jgi:BirA family biotin operon repressor/biotin-[acetyl-CoA-carboxylase] ligase